MIECNVKEGLSLTHAGDHAGLNMHSTARKWAAQNSLKTLGRLTLDMGISSYKVRRSDIVHLN